MLNTIPPSHSACLHTVYYLREHIMSLLCVNLSIANRLMNIRWRISFILDFNNKHASFVRVYWLIRDWRIFPEIFVATLKKQMEIYVNGSFYVLFFLLHTRIHEKLRNFFKRFIQSIPCWQHHTTHTQKQNIRWLMSDWCLKCVCVAFFLV